MIKQRIAELAAQHGGVRAAGRALKIDPAYLIRLASGEKTNPSARVLRALGLRRKVAITYERV